MSVLLSFSVDLVGVHDLLDEMVADNILRSKFVEVYTLQGLDDTVIESRCLVRRNVDLGNIACDNHFTFISQSGQKHHHLFGRGILGFIENDE